MNQSAPRFRSSVQFNPVRVDTSRYATEGSAPVASICLQSDGPPHSAIQSHLTMRRSPDSWTGPGRPSARRAHRSSPPRHSRAPGEFIDANDVVTHQERLGKAGADRVRTTERGLQENEKRQRRSSTSQNRATTAIERICHSGQGQGEGD